MEQQEKKLKVLVIVDAQQDFISGSLANEAAQKCIPNIVKKIKEFDGDAIFFTMDTHGEDYLDTPEGKKLPVKHCIRNTQGWCLNKDIADAVAEKEFNSTCIIRKVMKPTFASVEGVHETDGSIFRKSLVEQIFDLEKEHCHPNEAFPMEIELCGMDTDICVLHNAITLKAFTYDFAEITIDSKCCAGTTPENHKKALDIAVLGQINVK